MKIFSNYIFTYVLLFVIFYTNLNICFARESKLKDDFSGYSISEVFSIANKFDESPQKRANALYHLAQVEAPEISEQLIGLYKQIKSDLVDQSNRESHLKTMSQTYSQYPNLFNAMCLALGSTKTPLSIQFLREEANPKRWDDLFLPSQAKSMSEQDIVDDLFRHYVFRGLLEAAVNNPEIFDEIESYSDEYLRGTKDNVMSWLPEYKEKYYSIHPDKIPINDDPVKSQVRMVKLKPQQEPQGRRTYRRGGSAGKTRFGVGDSPPCPGSRSRKTGFFPLFSSFSANAPPAGC